MTAIIDIDESQRTRVNHKWIGMRAANSRMKEKEMIKETERSEGDENRREKEWNFAQKIPRSLLRGVAAQGRKTESRCAYRSNTVVPLYFLSPS